MSLDLVHDTQEAYRIVLHCMAHPGRVGTLATIQDRIELSSPLNKGLVLLALTLLDGETSFSVPRQEDATQASKTPLATVEAYLARLCSCSIGRAEEAAFLFLPLLEEAGSLVSTMPYSQWARQAILTACRGTFVSPQLGATLVLEFERIAATQVADTSWILEGPGIDGTSRFSCSSSDVEALRAVVDARNNSCNEFPLGVDLVIMDRESRLVCIPRTTSMREA